MQLAYSLKHLFIKKKDGNQSTEIVHGYWGLNCFKPILNSVRVQCKLTSEHTWQLSAVVLCLHYLEHQEETAARKGANKKNVCLQFSHIRAVMSGTT